MPTYRKQAKRQQQQQLLNLGLQTQDIAALQAVPSSYELHRSIVGEFLNLFKKRPTDQKRATIREQSSGVRNHCAAMRVIEIIKHAFDAKIRAVYDEHTRIALAAIASSETKWKLKDIYDQDTVSKYENFKRALYDVLKLSASLYEVNCRKEKELFERMYQVFNIALVFARVDIDEEVKSLLAKESKVITDLELDLIAFANPSQFEIAPIRKMVVDFFNNVQLMDSIISHSKTVSPKPKQKSPLPLRLRMASNLVVENNHQLDPVFIPLMQSCRIKDDNSKDEESGKVEQEPTAPQRSFTSTS